MEEIRLNFNFAAKEVCFYDYLLQIIHKLRRSLVKNIAGKLALKPYPSLYSSVFSKAVSIRLVKNG
jgi:hypothetical protein